jgi:hypothetical protein
MYVFTRNFFLAVKNMSRLFEPTVFRRIGKSDGVVAELLVLVYRDWLLT